MIIRAVWEHHEDDSLLYASNVIGAFTRGATKEEAMRKMPAEVRSFLTWAKEDLPISFTLEIVQVKESPLDIADADSDVLFDSERDDLTPENYNLLKARVLQSAKDFLALYEAFPDPHKTVYTPRKTFYGMTPVTAEEMYRHTKNVNAYYWGEIGVEVSNEGTMLENRIRGFQALETRDDYLSGKVFDGSWGEQWSLPKVLRRFLWHDRIHAKALYRMGIKTFGEAFIPNIFRFDL